MASTLNISLPEPLKSFVESETKAGDYGTPIQFVSEVLREYRDRRIDVNEHLLRSLQDDEGSIEISAEDWEHGDIVGLVEEHVKTL